MKQFFSVPSLTLGERKLLAHFPIYLYFTFIIKVKKASKKINSTLKKI